jgi:hypothetical protein
LSRSRSTLGEPNGSVVQQLGGFCRRRRKDADRVGDDLDCAAPLAVFVPDPRPERSVDGDAVALLQQPGALIRLPVLCDDTQNGGAGTAGADDGEPERALAALVAEHAQLGVGGESSNQTDDGDARPIECGKPPSSVQVLGVTRPATSCA